MSHYSTDAPAGCRAVIISSKTPLEPMYLEVGVDRRLLIMGLCLKILEYN